MGYVPKRKIYNLAFEDPEMNGLEVRIRGLTTGQYMDVVSMKEQAESGGETAELFEFMADRLVDWNILEDDGITPVPASLDGLKTLDMAFSMAIVNAWTSAIAGVPAPLEQPSSGGEPSLVASIPMESLSPSLAS